MTPPEFEFHLPSRLEDALELLRDAGEQGLAKAGGTDVMVLLKRGGLAPSVLVGLSGLPELKGIRRRNGVVSIGAGTTIAALQSDPLLAEHARGVIDAARRMATVQIRNLATVGGNLASAAACGDLAPILIAVGATIQLRSVDGTRALPLPEFFTGPRTTVLAPGELITRVEIPAAEAGSGSSYVKFGYRRGPQVTVVSAAAYLVQEKGTTKRVRLILGAVAPVPFRVEGASVLVGHPAEGPALDAGCAAAASECRPISDIRGSESYRRAIAPVIARQALTLAWRRSNGVES